jgi:phosphoribosyl-dephospho-CoA transferase
MNDKRPSRPERRPEEEAKQRKQISKELKKELSRTVSGPFENMTDDEVMRAVNKEIDAYRSESRPDSGSNDDPDRDEVEEGVEDLRAGRVTGEFSSVEELRQREKELEEEEAEWEALVKSPESQRLLDKMVKELEEDVAAGRVYDFDPSDPDWKERLEREINRERQREK